MMSSFFQDPENSEDPDFIKFCLNRGYRFGFDPRTTFRLIRNFTIPFINLNKDEILKLDKSSEVRPTFHYQVDLTGALVQHCRIFQISQ
jgi:hypothetical protein